MVTSPDSSQVLVPFYHLLYMLLASLAPLIQLLIKKGREGGERRKGGRDGGREERREGVGKKRDIIMIKPLILTTTGTHT